MTSEAAMTVFSVMAEANPLWKFRHLFDGSASLWTCPLQRQWKPVCIEYLCLENQLTQGMRNCNQQFPVTVKDQPSHGGTEDTALFKLGTDFKMSQAAEE